MNLTTESLRRFVGGQALLINLCDRLITCGEIRTVEVKDGMIYITWAWRAYTEEYDWEAFSLGSSHRIIPLPSNWVVGTAEPWSSEPYFWDLITETEDGRIEFQCLSPDFCAISAPGSQFVNPSQILGLELLN